MQRHINKDSHRVENEIT
jgi:hypothetical protein